jgi:hypothetical protein
MILVFLYFDAQTMNNQAILKPGGSGAWLPAQNRSEAKQGVREAR